MATTQKVSPEFRRLFEHLGRRTLLTPYLEEALVRAGSKAWPDTYDIKVYNKEKKWDGYFHPSMHAAMPPLLLYYVFHPKHRIEAERFTPESVMTLQIGSVYHAMFQSLLCHLKFTTQEECEVSFTNKLRHCSGTLDVRRVILPDGTSPPVEIKSWAYLPKEPVPQHVLQMQPYMDLGCGQPQPLGILVYIEKQHPHRFREFVIDRDEAVLRHIYGKWQAVREAVALNDPSRMENCCEPNSRVHLKCPARNTCRIGPPKLVTSRRTSR